MSRARTHDDLHVRAEGADNGIRRLHRGFRGLQFRARCFVMRYANAILAVLVAVLGGSRQRAAELQRSNRRLRDEVAERKRAEEELQRSEALLADGERLSHTGSWRLRLADESLRMSGEFYRILGYDTETPALTLRGAIRDFAHPDDRDKVARTFERAIRDREDFTLEFRIVRRDGAIVTVAGIGRVVVDESDELIELMGIAMDVTERRAAAEALRLAEAELAHVTRVTLLGELTASIAHEVNQPLTAIVNNAHVCLTLVPEESPDLEEVRAALSDVMSDAQRASRIIDHVRALATKAPSEKVPLRLQDVVRDVVVLTASASVARRVSIRKDVGPDIPMVLGDRVQLQQVLLNLVVNAMDAMETLPEPYRLLTIRGREEARDGGRAVTISVQDQGVGLSSAEMARLFQAFYTTKPNGMGMGLAISRSIIESHGGRLWGEPNPGPGATFSFTVPADVAMVARGA